VVSIESGDDVSEVIVPVWARHRANGSLSDKVRTAMKRMAVKGGRWADLPTDTRWGPRSVSWLSPRRGRWCATYSGST
jgi:hypothetical protein